MVRLEERAPEGPFVDLSGTFDVQRQQPVIEPGQSFEYTAGCPLTTPYGSMRGSSQRRRADGSRFDAEIAEFALRAPFTVH